MRTNTSRVEIRVLIIAPKATLLRDQSPVHDEVPGLLVVPLDRPPVRRVGSGVLLKGYDRVNVVIAILDSIDDNLSYTRTVVGELQACDIVAKTPGGVRPRVYGRLLLLWRYRVREAMGTIGDVADVGSGGVLVAMADEERQRVVQVRATISDAMQVDVAIDLSHLGA